jgi:thiamine-phosphate pyrophosphorylase
MIALPRLYPILDAGCFDNAHGLIAAAEELALAGVTLIQYRNKSGHARGMLEQARELKTRCQTGVSDPHIQLIMNDRADLCLAADFDGVHVGQDDLSPESVRKIIGPQRWLGVSTKDRPDPVVGLEGVRRARALTRKPLVAIGGITRANAASVIEAGADSVAVISDLLREPGKSAEEFWQILR